MLTIKHFPRSLQKRKLKHHTAFSKLKEVFQREKKQLAVEEGPTQLSTVTSS